MRPIFLILVASASLIFAVNPAFAQSDGNIAIGVYGKDVNGVDGVGAVYVYDDEGALLRIINNPDGYIHGQFGQTIDYVNGKIVVSAPWLDTKDNKNRGSLYVFDGKDASTLFTIKNPDSVGPVEFGWSLVSADTTIISSSPSYGINDWHAVGEVHVFDANSGNLLFTINNPEPNLADAFGNYVIFYDGKIIIGTPGNDAENNETSGTVYVFDASTGSLLRTINNPEPAISFEFGNSIAAVNDKLIIGAPKKEVDNKQAAGGVYVFDASTGSLLKTINNPEPDTAEFFGKRIVAIGNNFAVAAPDAGLYGSGKVFVLNGDTGSLIKTIDSPQKDFRTGIGNNNEFGDAMAYKDGMLLVGDRNKIVDDVSNAGGAYLYDAATWNLLQTIDNPHPVENDAFGNYVSFVGKMEPSQIDVSNMDAKQDSKTTMSETNQTSDDEIWVAPKQDTISGFVGTLRYDQIPENFKCDNTPKVNYQYVEKNQYVQYPEYDSLFVRIGGEATLQDFQMISGLWNEKSNSYAKDLSYHIILKNQDAIDIMGAIYSPDAYSDYSTLGVAIEANNKASKDGIVTSDTEKKFTSLFGSDYVVPIGIKSNGNYQLYVRMFDSQDDWVHSDTCGLQAIVPITVNGEDDVSVGQIQFSNILISAIDTNAKNLEMQKERIREAVEHRDNPAIQSEILTSTADDSEIKYLPPRKQVERGIPPEEISCRDGLELVFKTNYNHQPLCLTPDTKSKMIQRGLVMSVSVLVDNSEN